MMHERLVDVGIIVFIIYAISSIASIVNGWRTSSAFRDFLKNTQGNVNSTLIDMQATLQNLKKITGDISTVTEDVRQITDRVTHLEKNIRHLYQYFKDEFATTAEANLAGLKAGVKTGVSTLVKTLKEGRGGDHEGRTD
jgi:uncharacterized protein YoxC